MTLRDLGQGCDHLRGQRSGAAHVDIEPVARGGDLDVERLVGRSQGIRQRARGIECAVQRGIEDRAILDRNDGVAVRGGKADMQFAVGVTAGVQRDAAAAGAMRVDQCGDLAIDAGTFQRLDHDAAFPTRDRAPPASAGSRSRRQAPKYRQNGSIRCGLGSTTRDSSRRSG